MKRLLQKLVFSFSILLLTATASHASFTVRKEYLPDKQSYLLHSEITRQPACVHTSLIFQANIFGSETPGQLKKVKGSALKIFIRLQGTFSSIAQAEQEKTPKLPPTPLFVSYRQLRL